MKATDDACPLCGARSPLHGSAFAADTAPAKLRIGLRACVACGLAWQFPLARSTTDSAAIFTDAYQAQDTGSYFDPQRRNLIAELQSKLVASMVPAGAQVLDIGAGDGSFICAAAARGLKATGVDPAAPASSELVANAHLIRGTTTDIAPEARFDAVTAFDVIEHVEDPAALIHDCLARLKPGGLLFIETGNYQSSDRIAADEHWWCYQADHRWYFAPGNIALLLRQCGVAGVGLVDRSLRPGARARGRYAGPSRRWLASEVARAPWRAARTIHNYQAMQRAAKTWPDWAGISIFCVVACVSEHKLPLTSVLIDLATARDHQEPAALGRTLA